jgi:ATP-dependent DNA helicase Rep
VTFTNKAAREMKHRVDKLLDGQESRGLRVSTFHSLGLEILRKEHKVLAIQSRFTLFDETDKRNLLKSLNHYSVKVAILMKLDFYSTKSGNGKIILSRRSKLSVLHTAQKSAAAVLYADYVDKLKAYNAADFDDLILHCRCCCFSNRRKLWKNGKTASAIYWWMNIRIPIKPNMNYCVY